VTTSADLAHVRDVAAADRPAAARWAWLAARQRTWLAALLIVIFSALVLPPFVLLVQGSLTVGSTGISDGHWGFGNFEAVLRSRHFLHGKDELAPGILDIAWFDTHGEIISSDSWNNPEKRLFAVRRAARNDDGTVLVLTLFLNPSETDRVFRLPTQNVPTRMLIDSAEPGKPEADIAGEEITVAARSAVLTKSIHRDQP